MGLRRLLKKILNKKSKPSDRKFIQNVYQTSHKKTVLVSYITTPFKTENSFLHQNYLTAHTIAESFLEMGYNVDVVEFIGEFEINYDSYDVIFGFGHSFERSFYSKRREIPRINFITGAHEDMQNANSLKSIEDFYNRTGIWLPQEGNVMSVSWYYSMFNSDATIILARGYVYEDHAQRVGNRLYSLNNNILGIFNGLPAKTREDRSNNFLYLSGARQLSKGLSILLETARLRKDLNFYIVVFGIEETLEDYYQDVLNADNVFVHKHLRMNSKEMMAIVEACSYCVAPSYTDGMPGGTIEPMAAGLIPIVSKYCGFPNEDFIYEMNELTVSGLNNAIDRVLDLDDQSYINCSNRVKFYARHNYSQSEVKKELIRILKSTGLT